MPTLTDLYSSIHPAADPSAALRPPSSLSDDPVSALLSLPDTASPFERDTLAHSAAKAITGIDSPDGSAFSPNRQPLAPGQYHATVRKILEQGLTALDTPEVTAWKGIPATDRAARLAAAQAARTGFESFTESAGNFVSDALANGPDAVPDPEAETARRTAREDELIATHEADILSQNWLHQFKTMEPDLSPEARAIVQTAAESGTGIAEYHIEAFKALPEEEARRVAYLARAAMPATARAAFKDTALAASDMASRLFTHLADFGAAAGTALNDMGQPTRSLPFEAIDPALKAEIDRRELLLRDTNARKPYEGYNSIQQAFMGAATTLPYMAVAAVAAPAIAIDQFQSVRDRILAEGGNPDEAMLAQAAAAVAYAYVEKISWSSAFGRPLTTLGRRQLFMNLSRGGYALAAKQAGLEFALTSATETAEEMIQQGVEEAAVAHATNDPDAVSKIVSGFISQANTIGTMAVIGGLGTAAKGIASRSARLTTEDLADFAARQLKANQILAPTPPSAGLSSPSSEARAGALNAARSAWFTPPSLAQGHAALTALGYTPAQAAILADYLDAERALTPETSRPRFMASAQTAMPDPTAALLAAFPTATIEPITEDRSQKPEASAQPSSVLRPPSSLPTPEPRPTLTVKQNRAGRTITREVPNPAHAEWLANQRTEASSQQPAASAADPSSVLRPPSSLPSPSRWRVTLPLAAQPSSVLRPPSSPISISYTIEPDTAAPDTATPAFATSVQQATGGAVRAETYLAMNPDQQANVRRQYQLAHRGSFQILDAAGRTLIGTDGLMRLVAPGTQAPGTQAASNLTLYHENAHAVLDLAEQAGILTPEHLAVLTGTFGPGQITTDAYDKEAVADAFAAWLADQTETDEVKPIFQKIRDFIDRILQALGLLPTPEAQTRLEAAREAVFTAIRSGDFQGLSPYAGITFSSPSAPASAASQAPSPSSVPSVPSVLSPATPPRSTTLRNPAIRAADVTARIAAIESGTIPYAAPVRATGGSPSTSLSPSPVPSPAPSATPSPSDLRPPTSVLSPSPSPLTLHTPTGGLTFTAEWMWIDRTDLIDSESPLYPQIFQPRDRNRVASAVQIHTLSRPGAFTPDRLLDSTESDGGSPIIAGGNVILSGNGRKGILDTLARERRLQAEYVAPVTAWAAARGLNPPPSGMPEPVLVRRITSIPDADTDSLKRIAELSNRPKILQRSEAELAEADARLLTPALLSLYTPGPGGNLLAESNRPFMLAFIKAAGAEGDIDSKGRPTAALATRVQQAMLAAVIGTDTAARDLIRTLIEREPKLSLATLYNDLIDHAGQIIDTGLQLPALSLTTSLREAVRKYIGWRSSPDAGTLSDHLASADMFEAPPAPEVTALMRLTEAGRLGPVLARYATLARLQGSNTQSLGLVADRSPLSLLAIADRDTLAQGETPLTPDPLSVEPSPSPSSVPSVPSVPEFSFDAPRHSVTAQQDAEYMAAVKRGDTETTQQMVDARLSQRFNQQSTDIRHQLTSSSTRSPEAFAVAYLATRIMAGKPVTPADAEAVLKNAGVHADDPAATLAAAQARADASKATVLSQAVTADADLIDRMALDIDRERYARRISSTFATGASYASAGTDAALTLERARETAVRRDIESAEGYTAAEMQAELGVDLSAAVLATPDIQPTAQELADLAAERDRQRAADELADLGPQSSDLAPIPPSPTMQALLAEIDAAAIARADADRLEAQRRALVQAQNDRQDSSDPSDASAPSDLPSQPNSLQPKSLTALIAPAINSPEHFAAFVYEWATRRIRADRPELSPDQLYRHPAALRDLARTAQHILNQLAQDLLGTGAVRVQATRDINDIAERKTARAIVGDIAYIYGRIHAAALRTSREDLLDALERDIKRLAVEPGRFLPQREDLKRRVTAKVEIFSRTLIDYMRLNPTQIAAEDARLTAILATAAAEEADTGRKAESDTSAAKAADQLAVLRVYGGMIGWMPGQIAQAADAIRAQLTGDRARFETARLERQEKAASILGRLAGGIMRGPDDLQPDPNWLAKFTDANMGNLELRLRHAIRHSKGKLHADAEAAIQDLMVIIGEGETALLLALNDGRAAVTDAIARCYGSAKAGNRRLADPIPATASAALSRQGVALTYGQAIQLYGQLIQRDYAGNVLKNKRTGDLAVLRTVLDSRDLRFHAALVKWYADALPRLSEAQEAVTGLPMLSTGAHYIPARLHLDPRDFPAKVRAWSPVPATLTPRIKNNRDFAERRSILDVFTETLDKNSRFLAWGLRGIALRDILGSSDFQGTLERFNGPAARKALILQVTDILTGTDNHTDAALDAATKARYWTSLLFMSGNISSMLKQLSSIPAFAHAVGFRRTARYLTHLDPAAIRDLRQSPGFTARYGTGWNDATVEILADHNRSLPAKALALGLTPIGLVDQFVSLWFGQGYYRDLRATFTDQGMAPEEAKARALTIVSNIVEQTQQSGRLSNMTNQQRNGGDAAKLLLQFVTAPLQQMQFELEAIREFRAGTPGSRARLTRTLVINHLLCPALLGLIGCAFDALLGKEPPDDAQRWREALVSVIIGQYGALFIVGSFAEDGLTVLAGGKPRYGTSSGIPAAALGPMLVQAGKTAYDGFRYFAPDFITSQDLAEVTREDLLADLDKLGRKISAPYRHIRQAIENRQE